MNKKPKRKQVYTQIPEYLIAEWVRKRYHSNAIKETKSQVIRPQSKKKSNPSLL